MDNASKKIMHSEIHGHINNKEDIITPKIQKKDYRLMALWIIVGILAIFLLYYAYELIYFYF